MTEVPDEEVANRTRLAAHMALECLRLGLESTELAGLSESGWRVLALAARSHWQDVAQAPVYTPSLQTRTMTRVILEACEQYPKQWQLRPRSR